MESRAAIARLQDIDTIKAEMTSTEIEIEVDYDSEQQSIDIVFEGTYAHTVAVAAFVVTPRNRVLASAITAIGAGEEDEFAGSLSRNDMIQYRRQVVHVLVLAVDRQGRPAGREVIFQIP